MTRTILVLLLLATALTAGIMIGKGLQFNSDGGEASADGGREILYWKAPMDPNYRRDRPGKSPMGMDLVPVYADEVGTEDEGVVSIDPRVASNLGVRTALAERGVLSRRIDTVGYVGYDEDTFYQVNTRVDGWVEKLSIKAAGDPVRKGQVLFELYSPELVNAQQEYLAALRSGNTVLQNASRERLVGLGVGAGEIEQLSKRRIVRQRTRIYAREDGVVAHLNLREGGFVTPANPVMTIAKLDRVWVVVEIFERQAGWIEAGQQARIELDYLPGREWIGIVDYIYPELDSRSRTLKIRLRFKNDDLALRPNMFARATITGADSPPVVHVPRAALIRGGAVDRVVVARGDGRYRSRSVEPGFETRDRVAILSGLEAGERVVTSGQFLIDSESNVDTALARMDDAPVEANPNRAIVDAVVEGYRMAQRYITLRHDPIPQWSWPEMSMGFEVSDARLLEDLRLDQRVSVTIERRTDNEYVIVAIDDGTRP